MQGEGARRDLTTFGTPLPLTADFTVMHGIAQIVGHGEAGNLPHL